MSVCLSVRLSDDNFRKPWRRKFIFALPVHLEGIRVKFVYEDYRVGVKVTGTKNVSNVCSSIDQLRLAFFIDTRHMAPQTTRRGWSGLRLEGILVIIIIVIVNTFILCIQQVSCSCKSVIIKLSWVICLLANCIAIPALYSPCFAQVYTLEVTWSDGSKSQTHVNNSSLADWKVGHRLVSILKAIAHRRYDTTGRDETSDDRVDCETQLGGGKMSWEIVWGEMSGGRIVR